MTDLPDAKWDELGVTWRAIDPNIGVISSRLAAKLRRQSSWIRAGLLIGLPLCAVGVLLGLGTIGIGISSGVWNFVTRGVAIIAVSATLVLAVWALQSVAAEGAENDVQQMLALSVERLQKGLSLTRAALYACLIAGVFGIAGTLIRTHLGSPPKMSPVVDIVILALVAWVIFLHRRRLQTQLWQYRVLERALAVNEEA